MLLPREMGGDRAEREAQMAREIHGEGLACKVSQSLRIRPVTPATKIALSSHPAMIWSQR